MHSGSYGENFKYSQTGKDAEYMEKAINDFTNNTTLENMKIAKMIDERKDSKTISFDELLTKFGVKEDEL